MLTRLSRNVVCIKDIPSNLIEEAFFILKSSFEVEETKNEKVKKEIVMSEINEMIDEYSQKIKTEREQIRKQEIETKIKLRTIKIRTFIIASMFLISVLITIAAKM